MNIWCVGMRGESNDFSTGGTMVISSRTLVKSALVVSMVMVAGAAQAQLYWRADLGYSSATDAHIKDKNFALDGVICGNPTCSTPAELNDVGESAVLSAGVGWRFNPNFRADVTLAYRGWYELDDSDAFPSDFKADISSWNLMLNGYWDFTLTWGRPYVGAGVGLAVNKIDNIVNTGGALGTATFTHPGGTKSDLAWAVMAGVGIPINPNLTLDIGYRYIDLGKIESDSGNLSCAPVACPGATYSGLSGKLRAHELMIGLRF